MCVLKYVNFTSFLPLDLTRSLPVVSAPKVLVVLEVHLLFSPKFLHFHYSYFDLKRQFLENKLW